MAWRGTSPAPVNDRSTSVPAPYAPGGSVYNAQVPAAARDSASRVPRAYFPGGSVYNQQVPAAARPDTRNR
jgi:hypothetical protein